MHQIFAWTYVVYMWYELNGEVKEGKQDKEKFEKQGLSGVLSA